MYMFLGKNRNGIVYSSLPGLNEALIIYRNGMTVRNTPKSSTALPITCSTRADIDRLPTMAILPLFLAPQTEQPKLEY